MNVGVYPYPHGDPLLIDKIVNEFLSQGKFDKLRKECMSDADTKPAYQNLQQRVENTVTQFLKKQVWRPDLNKNQLRDSLRKHILESKFFDAGINRIVDQVVNPNVLATVFLPEVEEVVYNYLSIPRPYDKNQKRDDQRVKQSGIGSENKTSQENQKYGKYGRETQRREYHTTEEDYKSKDIFEKIPSKDYESSNELIKLEVEEEGRKGEDKIKSEPDEEVVHHVGLPEKSEMPSDESQESLSRMAAEGLHINETDVPPPPDSDDSAPLEINEKSMSESRDSEDSIMNQMSPISQGRLTPDLEEEENKPKIMEEEVEKKPLTFIGRIPKIKREDSKEETQKKEKLEVKNVYSSDESDSSKSYGKSDSDEKRKRNEKSGKEEKKREEDAERKQKDRKREESTKSSKDRHKEHRRERSKERHKRTSSSSSSQRERSSSHHKSSHRHKDSKSRRKEEEKKKTKNTDDHGKERNKKEDRRSTDRDSNERERGRSTGSRTDGENRKREKEQPKTEDGRGEENTQNEETEKESKEEKEREGQTTEIDGESNRKSIDDNLDFQKLLQMGALSRLEFPKLTDDFYVKFNSTGFRYFEEWEKTKLDCEEEFKEFVDEAENDLSLLSDDDSDFELEKSLTEENDKTIKNLLKGLGNFRRSVMFDPRTSEFYKWTNNKFYQKFRKKGESREGSTEKTESDESIKENINRNDKRRDLHLKLINKYRRKAMMRMGRPRRRQRKPGWGGIKEKNEIEGKYRVIAIPDLVETENTTVPNGVNSISDIYRTETVSLPESPEESWSGKEKPKETGKKNGKIENLNLHLPPSPDSDDINTNNGIATAPRKRVSNTEGGSPKKQTRRNYSQKYDSQDLYKPRPMLNGSRTRGRERELVDAGSPVVR